MAELDQPSSIPISTPRVDSSKCPKPGKLQREGTSTNNTQLLYFSGPLAQCLIWLAKKDQEVCFPINPDLADILGLLLGLLFSVWGVVPNFRTPAIAAATKDILSDPNPVPLPTHPGITRYVSGSPCWDLINTFVTRAPEVMY